jgi:hypothetical protein
MKIQKWLYFATQADEADLNGFDDDICLPADNLVSIAPSANNAVTMSFKSVRNNDPMAPYDTVVLNTIVGDAFEVANELVRYINTTAPTDGFITIADDVVTQDPGDAAIAAVYAHRSITSCGAISIASADASALDQPLTFHPTTATAEPSNTAAFAVNTHTLITTTAARSWRIPSAAAGRAGDWISILYTAAIGNGNAHSFTTTTDTIYVAGSAIRIPSGSANERIGVVDIAAANDNILTITGASNGDGGVGTRLLLRNLTGEANGWAVECVVEGQGTTAAASATSVFS